MSIIQKFSDWELMNFHGDPRLAEGQKNLDFQIGKSLEVGGPKIAQSGSHICMSDNTPTPDITPSPFLPLLILVQL